MTWNERDHPRKPDGEFTESWARRAADQLAGRHEPPAKRMGFIRVGDHPEGYGKVGAADPRKDPISQSTHPEAGGVWIDPKQASVGRRKYFNDSGWMPVSGYAPKAKSRKHKEYAQSRKWEDWSSRPNAGFVDILGSHEGGKIGYNFERADPEFLARMKRVRARGRQENARTPVRRTPRGTQVEGWMDQASAQLARRAGRG